MFQDGSDRLPTDSPPTPSTAPGHPPAERPRSKDTGDSPLQLVGRAETRPDVDRDRSSTVRRRANAIRVYNTAAEATATFPERFRPPTNRSWRSARRKCARRRTLRSRPSCREDMPKPRPARGRRVESDAPTLRSSPFASRRFHVLLNSLFKVLFNFPSRHLRTIGLVFVFSLKWSLSPTLGCILKQPDSWDDLGEPIGGRRGLTPALGEAPIRRTRTSNRSPSTVLNTTVPDAARDVGFGAGLFPLHSPLLRESLLVSFPPLINMLKFSG